MLDKEKFDLPSLSLSPANKVCIFVPFSADRISNSEFSLDRYLAVVMQYYANNKTMDENVTKI